LRYISRHPQVDQKLQQLDQDHNQQEHHQHKRSFAVSLLPSVRFSLLSISFSPGEAIILAHLIATAITITLSDYIYNLLHLVALKSLLLTSTVSIDSVSVESLLHNLPLHSLLFTYLYDLPIALLQSESLSTENRSFLADFIAPNYLPFFHLFKLGTEPTTFKQSQHQLQFHMISRPNLISTLFTTFTSTNSYLFTSFIFSLACISMIFAFILRIKPTINQPPPLYIPINKQHTSSSVTNKLPSKQSKSPSIGQFLGISVPALVVITMFLPILYTLHPTIFPFLVTFFSQHQQEVPNTPFPAFPIFPFILRVVLNPLKDSLLYLSPHFDQYLPLTNFQDLSSTTSTLQEHREQFTTRQLIAIISSNISNWAGFLDKYPHSFVILYFVVISLFGIGISLKFMPYAKSIPIALQQHNECKQQREHNKQQQKQTNIVPTAKNNSNKKSTQSKPMKMDQANDTNDKTPEQVQQETTSESPIQPQLQNRFSIPLIVIRKYYHLMIFFIAIIPACVDMPCISLAFMCCLMLLLTCEILRCFKIDVYILFPMFLFKKVQEQDGHDETVSNFINIPIGSFLYKFFQSFSDQRDNGPIILTHLYLLLGCAIPLWVVSILSSSIYHQQEFLMLYQSQQYLHLPLLPSINNVIVEFIH
jgi:hypothetical protein